MVTTNPYAYSGPGTRWTDTNGTTTSRLNVARVNADHLHWLLTEGFGLTAQGVASLRADSSIRMPTEVDATLDGFRVIAVDLDDPEQMWDLAEFRQLSRTTSWYAEVGHFPIKALIVINAAKSSVVIYDRGGDGDSLSVWMTLSQGSGYAMGNGTVTCIAWKDGRLVQGTSSRVYIADFVDDGFSRYGTADHSVYVGGVSERHDGNGVITLSTSPNIVHAAVNDVAITRDPLGSVDELGRPEPVILVATNGGMSLSSPGITAFYDASNTTNVRLGVSFGPDGLFAEIYGAAPNAQVLVRPPSSSLGAAWGGNNQNLTPITVGTGGNETPFAASSEYSMVALMPSDVIRAGGVKLIAGNATEGIAVTHVSLVTGVDSLTHIIDTVANHPPVSTEVIDVWALEDANGLYGKNLTNSGGITFAAAIVGSGAVTDGAPSTLSLTGDSDLNLDGDFTINILFKIAPTANTNNFLELNENAGVDSISIQQASTGRIQCDLNVNGSTDQFGGSGPTGMDDGSWHMVSVSREGSTGTMHIDGVQVHTETMAIGTNAFATDELYLFDNASGSGSEMESGNMLDHLTIVKGRRLTDSELLNEYRKGKACQQSTTNGFTQAADSNSVVGVSADPRGRFWAHWSTGQLTIRDAFDAVVLTDASPGGNIQDVAVWSEPGSDDPNYCMVTTTDLEIVQGSVLINSKEQW